jgi:hypothetical protein
MACFLHVVQGTSYATLLFLRFPPISTKRPTCTSRWYHPPHLVTSKHYAKLKRPMLLASCNSVPLPLRRPHAVLDSHRPPAVTSESGSASSALPVSWPGHPSRACLRAPTIPPVSINLRPCLHIQTVVIIGLTAFFLRTSAAAAAADLASSVP